MNNDIIFPKIKKSIEDFIDDDDGNITRKKLVTIGAMVIIMSLMYIDEVEAKHRSHSSHKSHSSHSSSSGGGHSSHSSHESHSSHSSSAGHSSHSSSTHSNSTYSNIDRNIGGYDFGPDPDSVPGISVPNLKTCKENLLLYLTKINYSVTFSKYSGSADISATVPPQGFEVPNVDVPVEVDTGSRNQDPLLKLGN